VCASLMIRDRHRVDYILMNTDSQLIGLVQRPLQRASLSVKPHDVKQRKSELVARGRRRAGVSQGVNADGHIS
jgi:hypothetical protein